jgi:uncharacterized protein (TIGR02246 family)
MATMQDKAAIRQIVRDIEVAWNNRDAYAYARTFVEDAELRMMQGLKVQGRDAIAQDYQMDDQCRNTLMQSEIENIRFIRPDVVHLEIISYLHECPFEKAIASVVMSKENSEWRIVTFNNAGILKIEGYQDDNFNQRD